MSADTETFEAEWFDPEVADPSDFGDPATRREARREAMERDHASEQKAHQDKAQDFLKEPKRSKSAKEYQEQAADVLRFAMRMTVVNEKTVADAASILTYGEQVAEKVGDLAAEDERVARILNFINGGTDNAYLNLAMVAMPMMCQIMRNHESDSEAPVVEASKSFRLFKRWTIRVPFKVRFKLRNKFMRSLTSEPKQLYDTTFTPEVRAALKEQGIDVPAYKG